MRIVLNEYEVVDRAFLISYACLCCCRRVFIFWAARNGGKVIHKWVMKNRAGQHHTLRSRGPKPTMFGPILPTGALEL